VPRVVKYLLAATVVFICLVVALWNYLYYEDQKNFSAAKNACERDCIQDSGGIDQCRQFLSGASQAKQGRLLRVLLVRDGEVSAGASLGWLLWPTGTAMTRKTEGICASHLH
jgi:hypothetical protein